MSGASGLIFVVLAIVDKLSASVREGSMDPVLARRIVVYAYTSLFEDGMDDDLIEHPEKLPTIAGVIRRIVEANDLEARLQLPESTDVCGVCPARVKCGHKGPDEDPIGKAAKARERARTARLAFVS